MIQRDGVTHKGGTGLLGAQNRATTPDQAAPFNFLIGATPISHCYLTVTCIGHTLS